MKAPGTVSLLGTISLLALLTASAGCAALNQQAQQGWQQARKGKATLALDQREHWLLGQLFGSTLRRDPIR